VYPWAAALGRRRYSTLEEFLRYVDNAPEACCPDLVRLFATGIRNTRRISFCRFGTPGTSSYG
jgi:hypothetical protein